MKISIVTVTFNSAVTIRDTMKSILSQDYHDIEHIIKDGGSSDDTLNIIGEYLHVSKLISEKDNGIYDAMNKGLRLATGDVIGFLNSDDVYSDSAVITRVIKMFEETNAPCLYGDLQYVDANNTNKVVRTWRSGEFRRSNFYYGWMPPHPAFFVQKQVYEKVGGFNTSLSTSSDYELMLRILVRYKFKAVYLPEVLVKMRMGGVSNASLRNRIVANQEDRRAWRINHLKPFFFTLYFKPVRKLVQFLIK